MDNNQTTPQALRDYYNRINEFNKQRMEAGLAQSRYDQTGNAYGDPVELNSKTFTPNPTGGMSEADKIRAQNYALRNVMQQANANENSLAAQGSLYKVMAEKAAEYQKAKALGLVP
jgi:hypothetical protein